MTRLPARALMACVTCYRYVVSPLTGPSCRFYPTCSSYALEALEVHGFFKGGWLMLKRILKCHPFYKGGMIDPVPKKDESSCSRD